MKSSDILNRKFDYSIYNPNIWFIIHMLRANMAINFGFNYTLLTEGQNWCCPPV